MKTYIKNLIPLNMLVPLKYWYSFFRGYNEPEMRLLKYLIGKESHVIDIGGNMGIYSYYMSKFCSKIEIFEPIPSCFKALNSWSHKKEGINVHNIGLSNRSGTAELLIPVDQNGVEHDSSASLENHDFTNARSESISLHTLDSYVFQNINFIKIDVEGHEFGVLNGSQETINSSKPAMLIEIEQRHNSESIFKIFNFIKALGYNIYFLDDGRLLDLSHFDISIHQEEIKQLSGKKYINNFLCLHADRLKNSEYRNLLNSLA